METKLPLGVVNAVPASQIVAGTVSVERALSLPEGNLTQEQKDSLMHDTFKNGYITHDKIAHQSGYRLARKRNGNVMLQIAEKEYDGFTQFSYKIVWRDIPTVCVDD